MKLKQLLLPLVAGTLMSIQTMAQKPKSFEKLNTVSQMVQSFRESVGGILSQSLTDSLAKWENIKGDVDYRFDEELQINKHLKAIDNRFSDSEESNEKYIGLFRYKIDQQIKEQKESQKPQLSPEDVVRILKEEGLLDDIATVEDDYLGNSDYIIIFISQKHGSKDECQEVQDQILEIKRRLAKKGIKVFVVEGVTQKEMDDESSLVFSNQQDTTKNNKYSLNIAMRFEKELGEEIFTSGVEDFSVKKEGDKAMEDFFNSSEKDPLYSEKRDAFQEKTINARNKVFLDYIKVIKNNTQSSSVVFQVGALHFENDPSYCSDLLLEDARNLCHTLLEMCREGNDLGETTSFIHIKPKSLILN